jgi:carbon-monoxide dehydrogenase medium subunit
VVSARGGYLSVCDVPTVVDVTEVWPDHDAAAEVALARLDPAGDIHATAAYRAQLVRVLTARVLRAAYDDARSRS